MAKPDRRSRLQTVFGVFLCAFGVCLAVYALLALFTGIWSTRVTLLLLFAWGALCLCSGILRLKKGRPLFAFRKKALNRAAKAVFALFCLCLVLLCGLTVWGPLQQAQPGAQAVIVLGAKIYGDQPSLMLEKRALAAAAYLSDNPQAVAVACGGFDGLTSEAQVIRRVLIAQGIDPNRIYLDEQSANTRQNVANAAVILSAWPEVRRVAVATSDYHLWRAARLVRSMGYEPVCVGADPVWYLRPAAHFQEMLSIARELLLP